MGNGREDGEKKVSKEKGCFGGLTCVDGGGIDLFRQHGKLVNRHV